LRRGIRLLSLARFSVVGPEGSRTDPTASALGLVPDPAINPSGLNSRFGAIR
jgi:hypothetical protein